MRTRVGYAGGAKKDPTYHDLGDHTEMFQVDFDPTRVSYEQLLGLFWASHDPTDPPWSRQYMAAVLCADDAQLEAAGRTADALAVSLGEPVRTRVTRLDRFYRAEDYHQKYRLRRHRDLWAELSRYYPHDQGVVDSTAAARMNGYLGGHGAPIDLQRELPGFGLSPAGARRLVALATGRA